MRLRRLLLVLATVLALAGAVTVTAGAAAQAAPPAVGAGASAYPAIDQAAVHQSVAQHDGVLTKSEALRLGLKPSTAYSADGARWLKHVTGGTMAVRPLSHYGCVVEVCISVTGSGLTVDHWETMLDTGGAYECSWGVFWEDGSINAIGPTECVDGVMFNEVVGTLHFSSQTVVCNTWLGHSSRPCAVVHA